MDFKESNFLLEFDYLYTYRDSGHFNIEEVRIGKITFDTLEEVKNKIKTLGDVRNIKVFKLDRLEDKILKDELKD